MSWLGSWTQANSEVTDIEEGIGGIKKGERKKRKKKIAVSLESVCYARTVFEHCFWAHGAWSF